MQHPREQRSHARRRGGRPRGATRAGFATLETLCAATLLLIAVLTLAQVSAATGRLHQQGREKSAALHAIEREFAAIENTAFTAIVPNWNGVGFRVTAPPMPGDALHAQPGDADGLPGQVLVTAPNGDPNRLIEVTVRVSWQGVAGNQNLQRTIRLSAVGTS